MSTEALFYTWVPANKEIALNQLLFEHRQYNLINILKEEREKSQNDKAQTDQTIGLIEIDTLVN